MGSPRRRGRVTIRDVAERANVSVSTVSHTFSGKRPISEETRRRVLETAEELRYSPNPSAQSLKLGRSGLVGLVLRPRDAIAGSISGTETIVRLIGAIAVHVVERNCALVLVPSFGDASLRQVPVDGYIVAGPYGSDPVIDELLERNLPTVMIEEDPDRPDLPWVAALDHADGMTRVLDGLEARGARNILAIVGKENNAWTRYSRDVFLDWSKRRGRSPLVEELYEGEGVQGARMLVEPYLARPDRPDAVVTSAGRFAAGVADIAQKLGLRIPQDLMIASLLDSGYTRSHEPAITSLLAPIEELGGRAVALLFDELDGRQPAPDPESLKGVIEWRASTGD